MKRVLWVLLASFALAAGADDGVPPADRAGDGAQQLRFDAYQSLALANQVLDAREVPEARRVNVYVSQSGLSKRRVRQIRLSADAGPSVTADLTLPEAQAIAAYDERARVGRFGLEPGPHAIHAELTVSESDAADAVTTMVATDYRFDKSDGVADLELRLDPGTLIGVRVKARELQRDLRPERKLLGIAVDPIPLPGASRLQYRLGSSGDPALSYAQHLARLGHDDTAFAELLQMRAGVVADESLAADYWLERARALRRLGMLSRAQDLCDRLDQKHELAGPVATERLAIANAWYLAGDLDRADDQLRLSQAALPEYLKSDWRYTGGMILIARQRSTDAVAILGETNPETIEAFRYMNASSEALRASAYGRFNLAVAMINSDEERRGLSWLDLLGRSQSNDPELMALRDKANLALGWHFLKMKQGRTALGVLGRIRSEGPVSDRALLGMGWAQLAPNGERLPRVQLAADPARAPDQINDLPAPLRNSLTRLRVFEPELHGTIGPRSFERDDPPKDREAGLRRAVKIWSVLLTRDEREPEVIEAMLAIGYAYDQLHQPEEARSALAKSVSTLQALRTETRQNEAFVADGQFIAAVETPPDQATIFELMNRLHLAPDDQTAPLYSLLGSHRDLGVLQARLIDARNQLVMPAAGADAANEADQVVLINLDASIQNVTAERTAVAHAFQDAAKKNLVAQRKPIETYLQSALLMAARVQDQPDLESRQLVDTH